MALNIKDLISEGRTIQNGLKYVPAEEFVTRFYDVYRLSDINVYCTWKECAIRYLGIYYPDDLRRFISYAEAFENKHYVPQYIANMIGVLEACDVLPSEKSILDNILESRSEEITRVEELEQIYINQTSESHIHNSIAAFHDWHASACVLFDKWFYPTDDDWIKFQNINGSGNGYVLKHYYDMVYSPYKKLIARLKDGRGIKGASIPQRNDVLKKKGIDNKIDIFISYAHTDDKWLDRLKQHLKVLAKYTGVVEYWEDTNLRGGDKWRDEITKAIERANVAILLVSTDFLASDFISTNELPPILHKAEEEGTRIIPLIVSPCSFEMSEISEFQAINSPDKTLADLGDDEAAIERVYLELIKNIQSLL